uniref:ABM domain-containing protein n=1 Tax=Panagrellus redivivus TaxID=6233 RepID=A0A7E4VV37_PANRE
MDPQLKPKLLIEIWAKLLVPAEGEHYAKFLLLPLVQSSPAHEACFAEFLRRTSCVHFGTDFIILVYDEPYMGIKETTVMLRYRNPSEPTEMYDLVTKYASNVIPDY